MLLLFLLSFTPLALGQEATELDTSPECVSSGVEFCHECAQTEDLSQFATHPDLGLTMYCTQCCNGWHLMAGRCYSMEDLLEDLTVSIVDDIAVFRSDLLLDGYKSMWTWQPEFDGECGGSNDYDVYNTLGYVAQEVLGDEYHYLYTSGYNDVPAALCADQTTEAGCGHVKTCQWQEDETCLSVGTFPDQYYVHDSWSNQHHAQWGPYFYPSKLNGVVRYNFVRNASLEDPDLPAFDLFNTHFHEIAHHHLVHGMELNPSTPHWGYSVLERQSTMSDITWLPEEVSCFETGEPVTSPESCPQSGDGKRWLHFENTVEMVREFSFSDWELLPMGLIHPDDLAGQSFYYCGSVDQETPLEVVGTETGTKVGCNSVVFVTPEEWAWGAEYHPADWYEWRAQEGPIHAAHMVIQGTDEELPTTYDDLNAYWKKAADLLPELTDEFKTATRDNGEIDFSVSFAEPECYIFRDDHLVEGDWFTVGGVGDYTMEECEIQCTLREDCTAWKGYPYEFEKTYYEVTGEQNGVVWGTLLCTLFTGEVTFTPNLFENQPAYGPPSTWNADWSGEKIFPIPEGCDGEGLTFPPTDAPSLAPSTEFPLCYLPHTTYASNCDTENPVGSDAITDEECQFLCSEDEACLGWQNPSWSSCRLLKGSECAWLYTSEWSSVVSYEKNVAFWDECVNPTAEPTSTAEPTPEPTEATLEPTVSFVEPEEVTAEPTLALPQSESGCYYQFTDAYISGGVWETEMHISEEECEALCSEDSTCVGYNLKHYYSSSAGDWVDKCYNYHGATTWQAGFYTWSEYISYKKILPEPEFCLPQPDTPEEPVIEEPEEPIVEPEEPIIEEPEEPIIEPEEPIIEEPEEPIIDPEDPIIDVPEEPIVEPEEPIEEPIVEPEEPIDEPVVEITLEPTELTLEPTEATLEPSEATLEPTMATNEPTEMTLEPTEATLEPSEATLEPTIATNEPTELTLEPTEATLEPTEATLEPTEATLEPSEATLEPTMATNEPTEMTLEPTEATLEPTEATSEPSEATLEPTMATNEPTEATEEPTAAQSSTPQATVKFTQIVSAADVECEPAKAEVQSANAQAMAVSASSVEVSGCERRMLATDESVDTYEFLISVLVDSATEADRLQVEVSSSTYAEQVTERLSTVVVTSSSTPVVKYEVVSEESESEDQESLEQFSSQLPAIILGSVLVLIIVSLITVCCLYAPCSCGRQSETSALVEKYALGSPPNKVELVL